MSLKKNIIANYLGQGWIALMHLAFIPIYIQYLGMEAYGLIGIFATLQASLTLLDMGMTPTLNREMARYTAGSHTPQSIRELLRSLELLCIGLAFFIAVSTWVASAWIAENWLRAEHLPLSTVSSAIASMGLVAALRFIESIYRGAILGLQTHAWLNVVTAISATARGLGAVGVLAWFSASIEVFFLWQGVVSLVSVLVLAYHIHHVLPCAAQPVRFSKSALSGVWKFAHGMIATTFFSLLITQVDKILLSRLLSLEEFGTYMLAATVANALMLLVAPLAQGYYPRFTELVTKQDQVGLIALYHQGAQLMAIAVVPVALILIFHGEFVLSQWTNDVVLSHKAAPLVALLALGTALLGLMNIPYMLQLAYGWSNFAAKVNAMIVVVQIPTLYCATLHYGAIGAAWVWLAITSIYILVVVPIMHKYLLPTEKWTWYWRDNILPGGAACITGGILAWILTTELNLVWLLASSLVMFVMAALLASDVRSVVLNKLNLWKG